MNKMNKKGFTLIEMLVVIAIIAILVAIIIPTVMSATDKSKAATDAANLRSAKAVITTGMLGNDAAFQKPATGDKTVTTADALKDIPTASKLDGGAFSAKISSTGEVTVEYGGNGISYYANIAENGPDAEIEPEG